MIKRYRIYILIILAIITMITIFFLNLPLSISKSPNATSDLYIEIAEKQEAEALVKTILNRNKGIYRIDSHSDKNTWSISYDPSKYTRLKLIDILNKNGINARVPSSDSIQVIDYNIHYN